MGRSRCKTWVRATLCWPGLLPTRSSNGAMSRRLLTANQSRSKRKFALFFHWPFGAREFANRSEVRRSAAPAELEAVHPQNCFRLGRFALKWRRGLSRVPDCFLQVDLARATANWYSETRCRLRYSSRHADSLRPLAGRTAPLLGFSCRAATGAHGTGLVCQESEVDQRPTIRADGDSRSFVSGGKAGRVREGGICRGWPAGSNR